MNQTTIFDFIYPKYKITKPIRLIELFAGYGSQALALKYLGVEFEHWKTCEWAVKSIQAYKDMHFTDEKEIDIACTKSTREGNTRADSSDYISEDVESNYKLKIKNATKQGYLEAIAGDGVDISSRMEHHRGTVQKDKIQTLTTSGGNDRGVCIGTYQYSKSDKFMNGKDTSDTLQTTPKEAICYNDLRIRKLSPRECGRLMGVKDKDITNMLKNQSNSSAYHLFGDSIIVSILMAIFGELLDINWIEKFKEIENKFIDK